MKNFDDIKHEAAKKIKEEGNLVYPDKWQATDITIGMIEIYNFDFTLPILGSPGKWKEEIKPDLPWAEDHFQERISGIPMNPAPSYSWWPYYKQDKKWRRVDKRKFSHTYPERLWAPCIPGIRYMYGNLGNVIDLLEKERFTRQAFIPIWFPEDTGAVHGERVPCTIGYHLYNRNNQLHITYPIRSCDFRRHFKNDVYMAGRLVQWVLKVLQERDDYWKDIEPGTLTMNVWNLHVFEGEEKLL